MSSIAACTGFALRRGMYVEGWQTQDSADSSNSAFRRFIARQPILDRGLETVGYELLFRNSWTNSFNADGEVASRHVIDTSLAFGFESLVANKIAFVNCTYDLITQEMPVLLPRATVLELLENIQVDAPFVEACKKLRNLGYRFALDDFTFDSQWEPLFPLLDFIKVDFRTSSAAERKSLLRRCSNKNVKFLAEKIETEAEFRTALNEGFHLFQGYFFKHPTVLARPALDSLLNRFDLMKELQYPDLRFSRILELLKRETSVSFRLLRLANSAAMAARETVTSLQRALVIVGEDHFRKLAITALTVDMCGTQPSETHRTLLQTCRFCETLAEYLDCDASAMYIFGMLSVILPLLDLRPDSFAAFLGHHPGMLDALTGHDSKYADVLRACDSLDRGDWWPLADSSEALHIPQDVVVDQHIAARAWADDVLMAMN